nr:MAG TPA: protein of unknown function DUF859 [Caudoviricetes sp.]
MASWRSNTYSGRYLELTITESVDSISNTSILRWQLVSTGGNSTYYTIGETTVTINGTQVYHKDRTLYTEHVFPCTTGSVGGSITVPHDTDGKKTIEVSFTTRVYEWQPLEYGGSLTLTDIDRTAPSVSHSVSNITANGLKISASSSVTASKWWYSLNGGTSWTEFGSEGTYKEVTVTGLTPNTTYNVQVRARKKTNAVDGVSAKSNAKTLGGTVINSAPAVTADDESVTVTTGLTVYDRSFYHKLSIKNGNTVILTTRPVQFTASGTVNKVWTLTGAERTKLLNAMADVKSFEATLSLATYTDAACTAQVGTASEKLCTITTTESVSKPTFTDFSYVDSRGLVGKLTGNTGDNVILVQLYSSLIVNAVTGTAKNGATIKSYSASIGSASKTSDTTAIGVGAIDSYGDSMLLTVSCIDSRGYATSVTKSVKVLKYEKPKVQAVTIHRKDEVEDIIQMSFRGTMSSLKPDGSTERNSLKYVGYYYKKTNEDEWSSYCSVKDDVSVVGTSFSFVTEQLMKSATEALSLDAEASYDIHLVVRDQLDVYASYDDYAVIPHGKPLIALRKRNSTYNFARVGINNPNPTEALDVDGKIKMNGVYVSGYIGVVAGALGSYKSGGSYFYGADTDADDAPIDGSGLLEVLPTGSNVVQRFTQFSDGKTFVRACLADTWTTWILLNGDKLPDVLGIAKGGTGGKTQSEALANLKALPLAGGTMNAGSKITHPGNASYWATGLDGAILRRPNAVSNSGVYYPLVASKTVAGNWAIGTYDNQIQFNYIADADSSRRAFLFNSDGNFYWPGGTQLLANGTLGASDSSVLRANFDGRIFKNLLVMMRSISNSGNKYSSFVFPTMQDAWGLFLPTYNDYYRAAITISGSGGSMACMLQMDSNVSGVTAWIYATA